MAEHSMAARKRRIRRKYKLIKMAVIPPALAVAGWLAMLLVGAAGAAWSYWASTALVACWWVLLWVAERVGGSVRAAWRRRQVSRGLHP